jgi:hypothetical protein
LRSASWIGVTGATSSIFVETLVGQRVFGLVLGYEDLNVHDELCGTRRLRCWLASSNRCCGRTGRL